MKKAIVFITLAIIATACGKGEPGAPGQVVFVPTPAASPATPTVQAEIDAVVAEENQYRAGLGQSLISNGLTCTLSTITGGQYIQSGGGFNPTLTGIVQVATFLHADVFDQPNSSVNDGLNVLPPALRANPTYKNLIKLVCSGQLVVTQTGYYSFDLSSDDASLLYLDGAKLIDNDNSHGITLKTGTKYLRRGVHSFALHFAQTGGGNQALILKANGGLIPGAFLYH